MKSKTNGNFALLIIAVAIIAAVVYSRFDDQFAYETKQVILAAEKENGMGVGHELDVKCFITAARL